MKKLFLLSVIAGLSLSAFAQKTKNLHAESHTIINSSNVSRIGSSAARTTAVGDTDLFSHFGASDTLALYPVGTNADSGYVVGTDAYGDKAFAERYDVDSTDSTIKVIGVESLFGGKISDTTTKKITYNVWNVGAQIAVDPSVPHVFYSGLPTTAIVSMDVPVAELGIGLADTAADTFEAFLFPTPTAYLRKSFFIGYNINYTFSALGGDTIGLYTNKDGERAQGVYTVSGADTIINDVNATMYDDNTWHDDLLENFNYFNNLEIFPIVVIGHGTLAVKGITKNDFTFFGNYPNPAVNSTNIKFSLASSTDVTIVISDMRGHAITTISEPNLGTGEHIVPVQTSDLASGNYIYTIRTATGNGIASVLTVVK